MSIKFRVQRKIYDSSLCEPTLNILAHAQVIELEIGSRCGGHGVCGGDRIRLSFGNGVDLSPLTEKEKEHLSDEQIQSGYRLACQCFPQAKDQEFEFTFGPE